MIAFRAIHRKITSESFDARLGQTVCWLFSGVFLLVGFFKLVSLSLPEVQLSLGILLILIVALLGVILGILLPIAQTICQLKSDERQV